MKVLLVEDHPYVAETTSELLRVVYEYEVDLASNGAEAIAAADRFRPDVVLIDLNLPDMDGYEVARRLRENPELEAAVLVAVTGLGYFIDGSRAAASGIDAYFEKPMDFDVLESLKRRK